MFTLQTSFKTLLLREGAGGGGGEGDFKFVSRGDCVAKRKTPETLVPIMSKNPASDQKKDMNKTKVSCLRKSPNFAVYVSVFVSAEGQVYT
jgi:hypothetical protein